MLGFRIEPCLSRASREVLALYQGLPVANISDCMNRMTAGGSRLRPYHGGAPMVGTAFTVRTRPGDNLAIHMAIDLAEAGDIIVVDGGGDLTNALIGELMVAQAVVNGIGGFVIDGSIRDLNSIRAGQFPVYAAGITHRGPYKDGPGEVNVTISIGGMTIRPGDIVVGDDDGVLCVPQEHGEAIATQALSHHRAEVEKIARIGNSGDDRSWVKQRWESLSRR